MKKMIRFIVCSMLVLSLPACTGIKNDAGSSTVSSQSGTTEAPKTQAQVTVSEDDEKSDTVPRMVMLDDKLFVETGEISSVGRCGNMDFHFTTSVEQGEPVENFQTNFGTGYGGQYGIRKNRIEINIDHEWHSFAYNENNLDGVSLNVKEHDRSSADLEIRNDAVLEVMYGEDFLLEVFDEDLKTWISVPYISENFAFHDIAHVVEKGKKNSWSVDWTSMYGELDEGNYRIIKEVMDFRDSGDYTVYTLSGEFEISGNES